MDRFAFRDWVLENYGVAAESPWGTDPGYWVFRHGSNRKWFALVMDIPRGRLGLPGEGRVDVVNLKIDPRLIATLRQEPGFFPAYHMNKENWITAALDVAEGEKLRLLTEMSYELTREKGRGKGKSER